METSTLPFLLPAAVDKRRLDLDLCSAAVDDFVEGTEFVALGNSCAVTDALVALNLRRRAYPFDWTRTPTSGIIHLYGNNFLDFFTYSEVKPSILPSASAEAWNFLGAKWGGSFWHHDPRDMETRRNFNRRIERLLGLHSQVLAEQRRVFVHAVNSSQDLELAEKLHRTLQESLPRAEVKLLLLVDMQESEELLELSEDILVFRVDEHIFSDAVTYAKFSFEGHVENYARGIAEALRFWARADTTPRSGFDATPRPGLESIAQLLKVVDAFVGSSTAATTFWPWRIPGEPTAEKYPDVDSSSSTGVVLESHRTLDSSHMDQDSSSEEESAPSFIETEDASAGARGCFSFSFFS